MNEYLPLTLFLAGLVTLTGQLLVLAVGVRAMLRAWRHERNACRAEHEARQDEQLALLHAQSAERDANRAEATLPPDVIPFPQDAIRGGALPEPTVLKIAEVFDGECDWRKDVVH